MIRFTFAASTPYEPYPLYDRMRAEAPVHRIGDSVFYAVCGWDAVMEVINRVELGQITTALDSAIVLRMGSIESIQGRTCCTKG